MIRKTRGKLMGILQDRNPKREGWYEALDMVYGEFEKALGVKRVFTGTGSSLKFKNSDNVTFEIELDALLSDMGLVHSLSL